jgi:hypothetical protein
MNEKSIVPATLVALLVDRDEAVLSLLEAAKLLLVTIAGIADTDALIPIAGHIVLFLAAPSTHDAILMINEFLLSTIAAVMLSSEEIEVGFALAAFVDQIIRYPHRQLEIVLRWRCLKIFWRQDLQHGYQCLLVIQMRVTLFVRKIDFI